MNLFDTKSYLKGLVTATFVFLSLMSFVTISAQNNCVAGCNGNTYVYSDNPATIEYDNIVGLYHSTILKEEDNTFLVWGASAAASGGNQLSPLAVTPANGFTYSGEILKATGGAGNTTNAQFTILTTEGLYFWGKATRLVANSVLQTSGNSFTKGIAIETAGVSGTNQYTLPADVEPGDVKMLFGTDKTLGLVTCTGDAFVLTQRNYLSGNVQTADSDKWYQVMIDNTTPLKNVVAMRGTPSGLIALTTGGDVYTWGNNVYTGGSAASANIVYATQMDLTAIDGSVKMIGMTGKNSAYILTTDGKLYSLGNNEDKQLGDFTSTERTDWVRAQKSSNAGDYFNDVLWISPNEHSTFGGSGDYGYAAINIIDSNYKLWAWGRNNGYMLGGSSSSASYDPMYMPGTGTGEYDLKETDNLLAVETGGHTSMTVRQCSGKYGYVGHRVNGSMGDGTNDSGNESKYNFEDTESVRLCGAPGAPIVRVEDKEDFYCVGAEAEITVSPEGGTVNIDGPATYNNGTLTFTGTGTVTLTYVHPGNECEEDPEVIFEVIEQPELETETLFIACDEAASVNLFDALGEGVDTDGLTWYKYDSDTENSVEVQNPEAVTEEGQYYVTIQGKECSEERSFVAVVQEACEECVELLAELEIVCGATTVDLTDAIVDGDIDPEDLSWFLASDDSAVADPSAVGVGVYYALIDGALCSEPFTVEVVKEEDCGGNADNCIVGCNENTFLNTGDPNTLEYDNIVNLFHSTIVKEANGTYKIWGAAAAANGVNNIADGKTWPGMPAAIGNNEKPVTISAENGYIYNGEILKATGGSGWSSMVQFAILTTEGIYVWGLPGVLIHSDLKSTTGIGKINPFNSNSYGLPFGVNPEDVKMFTGNHLSLALVTCTGEAYVLTGNDYMPGNGIKELSGTEHLQWHRVKTDADTDLYNVVAMRGTTRGFFALTSEGDIYTWGKRTYIANGVSYSHREYATLMTKPAGVTIKMIGITQANSYFILGTNGMVYALGNNGSGELGVGDKTRRSVWDQVRENGTGSPLSNIAWISPNEHSGRGSNVGAEGYGVVSAMTSDGKIWSWGNNSFHMIGDGDGAKDPTYMVGDLDNDDYIIAIATGGHTTLVIKDCEKNFGYIGHRVKGSMGDGTHDDGQEYVFNFTETATANICAAVVDPVIYHDYFLFCPETEEDLFDLELALEGSSLNMSDLEWWTTPDKQTGTEITAPYEVGAGSYYVFAKNSSCEDTYVEVVVELDPECSVLPIRLLSFDADKMDEVSILTWTTVIEENSSGFDVEVSIDGRNWKNIGFVSSQSVSGNSIRSLEYTFTDRMPSSGVNYYRLKMVDLDGYYEYSQVRRVAFGTASGGFVVYPNPTSGNVSIMGLSGSETVKVYNSIGLQVTEHTATEGTNSIDLSSFAGGTYQIVIISTAGEVQVEQIVKVK